MSNTYRWIDACGKLPGNFRGRSTSRGSGRNSRRAGSSRLDELCDE